MWNEENSSRSFTSLIRTAAVAIKDLKHLPHSKVFKGKTLILTIKSEVLKLFEFQIALSLCRNVCKTAKMFFVAKSLLKID